MAETKRRSMTDDLTALVEHILEHQGLPEIVSLRPLAPQGISLHLPTTKSDAGLRAWSATLTDVTWRALDLRKAVSAAGWYVHADGLAGELPVSVWAVLPSDYADTADTVRAVLAMGELHLCIDETCPNCGWPERWFSPARQQFGCPRCSWISNERSA